MNNNFLLIGKNSFIGKNIYNYARNKLNIKRLDYSEVIKKKDKFFSKFDFLINCSLNKDYVNKSYNISKDHDYTIAKKIKFCNIKYIFLSTRKVYKPQYNLKETSLTKPSDQYSKNKLITENKLQTILGKKLTILRISNVIGFKKKSKRSIHKTFVDIFFENIKKGNVLKISNEYKDFLTIKDLCNVIYRVIRYNLNGTYNVSLGKKIYLKRIIEWLNYHNQSKFKIINMKKYHNNDSFTLNNKKLLKRINIKISINKLEKECKEISKNFFRKK